MVADMATLALGLTNEPAIAGAKATGAAFDEMGAKGEAAARKIAASSNPVTEAIKRQAVTVEQGRAAWAASGGDMHRFAQELQKMVGTVPSATGQVNQLAASVQRTDGVTVASMRNMGAWAALQAEATGHVGAHSLAVGRLAYRLESMTSALLGVNSALGLLGASSLKFGVGDIYTIALIGGIYAIIKAYEILTKAAREATKAQDEALTRLASKFGPETGPRSQTAKDYVEALKRQQEDNAHLKILMAATSEAAVARAYSSRGEATPFRSRQREIDRLTADLANTNQIIGDVRANAPGKTPLETVTVRSDLKTRIADAKEYAKAIAQAVAETNKLNIEQAKKTGGIETDRRNADLLLAAAKDGTQAYQDQVDAIAVQNRLEQDGIQWFDARYDAAKKSLEITIAENRETQEINNAREAAANKAKQDAQKAAEEAERPFKNMMRGLQTEFATFFDNIFTKGIKSFGDLVSSIKQMFLKMISELLATKLMGKLAGIMAGMLGTAGVAGAQGVGSSAEGGGMLAGLGGQIARNAAGAAAAAVVAYQVGGSMYNNALSDRENRLRGGFGGAASGAVVGGTIAGPIGAAVGAIVGFTAGVLGSEGAARKAAKALLELQAAVKLSQAAYHAAAIGDTLGAALAQEQAGLVKMLSDINSAYPGSKNEVERNNRRARAQADEALNEAKLHKQDAEQKQYATEDLAVRNLRATGQGDAADKQAFVNQQQREMQAAIDANKDATYLSYLATVQNNELMAYNNKLLHNLSALNTVSGYKLQAAVFGAMNPWETGIGIPPQTLPGASGSTPPGGQGDLTVKVVLSDGTAIGKAVLKDFKSKAQKQFGDSSLWSQVQ